MPTGLYLVVFCKDIGQLRKSLILRFLLLMYGGQLICGAASISVYNLDLLSIIRGVTIRTYKFDYESDFAPHNASLTPPVHNSVFLAWSL